MKIVVIGGSGLIGKKLIPLLADPQARYFGAALDARGLTPDGATPRIGPTRFEEWLRRSVSVK